MRSTPLYCDTVVDVHWPDQNCTCAAGSVYDFKLREFQNGTLHVYRYCKTCGGSACSPVKRESIGIAKWHQLLIESGQEVSHV